MIDRLGRELEEGGIVWYENREHEVIELHHRQERVLIAYAGGSPFLAPSIALELLDARALEQRAARPAAVTRICPDCGRRVKIIDGLKTKPFIFHGRMKGPSESCAMSFQPTVEAGEDDTAC